MANALEIFNSKIKTDDLVGKDKFFNNSSELTEFNKLQQKYISNVDYGAPANFARFGSAEEYYKNAITYINTNYPYDGSTATKLGWINSLNELEYHIFKKEYPRSTGFVNISGTQYIQVFSHVKEPKQDAKESYNDTNRFTSNTNLNFETGITFEGWINLSSSVIDANLLTINVLSGSTGSISNEEILNLKILSGSSPKICVQSGLDSYIFDKNIQVDEWHHYGICIQSGTIKLFVDGQLEEEKNNILLNVFNQQYIFTTKALLTKELFDSYVADIVSKTEVFRVGGGNYLSLDNIRLWNETKSVEDIGRNWFTHIDGNDFSDPYNTSLLFYYKFNEGWDQEYGFLCLDYSGRQNDGEIIEYATNCRNTGSAFDLSGIVQDIEDSDIIFKGLSYSQEIKNYYTSSVEFGKEYDEQNIHMLYNKFPGWLLQQEEDRGEKHLKQIIQIVSSYFDDLYNKISEVTNYKTIRLNDDVDNIYPFYDKILTSNGFNVTDLFNNLDMVEKVSSRNDTTLFDEDIQKIKNAIFQNIYNNLAYILKSKGTEKSLKSLIGAYGLNEDLIRVNLYSDGAEYSATDRSKQAIVKKKTVTMLENNSIYLSSTPITQNTSSYYYTLEVCTAFNNDNSLLTSSLFGIQNNTSSLDLSWDSNVGHYYVTLENSIYGTRFVLNDNFSNVTASNYIKDFYDGTAWNLALRKKPTIDTVTGSSGSLSYEVELYGVNQNRHFVQEFSCSIPYSQDDGYLRYYIGARKNDLTGSTIYEANSKFLYCNFWEDYLDKETLSSHNRDILNYGISQ